MPRTALEEAVAGVLYSSRSTLAVSRARCYAMDPTGFYRLAASFGFVSRFGPEETLPSGHPLIEWVQRHRRPIFVNAPNDAGPLGELMERDHYAHSLAAPIYQGSRLVGILELQDRLGGASFGWEDLRRVESVVLRIEEVLARFDATSVALPEPLAQEDREALFLDPGPARVTEFPPPPDLFSGAGESANSEASGPEGTAAVSSGSPVLGSDAASETSPELARRQALVFRGFGSALLLDPEIDAVVFSQWMLEKAQIYLGARRPLSNQGRDALMSSLETALRSAVAGASVPVERVFQTEFPLGQGDGEIHELAGIQTSVVFSGRSTLLFSLLFARPPDAASEPALKETHRLVRAAVLQLRGAERYRLSYRSLVHFLIEPDRRAFPQLKAHALAVGSLCRRFASALKLPSETVEQFTVAGLLHDIGLKDLEIPYERIAGRRALDLQELGVVRQHAALGAGLVARIAFPYPIVPLVRHHHERWDGAGYPDRLAGDRIPLGARVIGIAEAYDAMVAAHSYRAPISQEAALEIISLKAGTQFDPELARQFCGLVRARPRDGGESPAQTEP